MTIAIAADHAGFPLKQAIIKALPDQVWLDLGTHGPESVDYPDFAGKLAGALADGLATRGILICGSGVGISIAANRYAHIRCALVSKPEVASLARAHNDANVLAMGARFMDEETALACIKAFLETSFEGGRHARRVDKLGAC